eukprot:Selendium_serpulae@DN5756_c0_g1_i1.p1
MSNDDPLAEYRCIADVNDRPCPIDSYPRTPSDAGGGEPSQTVEQADTNIGEPGFSLLTWNIDGLEEKGLHPRTRRVAEIIQNQSPDVVLLQELVPEGVDVIKRMTGSRYDVLLPEPRSTEPLPPYFCGILLRKDRVVQKAEPKTEWFGNSVMGRHLLTVQASLSEFGDEQILFSTTHLESTKDFAKARREQLRHIFKKMETVFNPERRAPEKLNYVVVGGDLNVRDSDVTSAGQPGDVHDVWQFLGGESKNQYTWDMLSNNNKTFEGEFKPRCRFDRVYVTQRSPIESNWRKTANEFWVPKTLTLVGKEQIDSCEMFRSDHYGLMIRFHKTKDFVRSFSNSKRPIPCLVKGQ